MSKANLYCDHCAQTGIVWSAVLKDPEDNQRKVFVEICEHHTSPKLAEKAIEGMEATGLPIVVVDAGSKLKNSYCVERAPQSGIQSKDNTETAVA